jgi:4-hydroxy-4-methyl-2-oxoglutarate aldolase
MSATVGFRVIRDVERPPEDAIREFSRFSAPDISDAMHRSGAMDGGVCAVNEVLRVAGPAITVRLPAGDNLMIYRALEVCRPGDVLVIETRRSALTAIWGDKLSRMAKKAGVAGMVTDGCVRDRAGIREIGLPVFASPIRIANGPHKNGPGEVNTPVSVGGVVVLPGDLVVGDGDGVVVVHRMDIAAVLEEFSRRSARCVPAN